jgi:GT2 family glycosyltransferase
MARKSVYDEIGGINEAFTMSPDVDLGARLGKKGKVVFSNKLKVTTSFRRWQREPLKTLYTYLNGYVSTIWLRKPPTANQKPVR